jgi:hypothetical protein
MSDTGTVLMALLILGLLLPSTLEAARQVMPGSNGSALKWPEAE